MTDDSLAVIPSPEHRKPGDPGVHVIGTVSNLDGTTVTVYVDEDMAGVTGPVEAVGAELAKFLYYVTSAGLEAAENAGRQAGEDGGNG